MRTRRKQQSGTGCPVWHAITGLEEIRASLPNLPFKHDGTEAKAVSKRIARVEPTSFVRVLSMVFDDAYGQFRILSCPTFGLYKELVRHLCSHEFQFTRVVSRFAVRGSFMFAGMPPLESREKLERELLFQMESVQSGKGEDIVDAVMLWTRTVRLRALQDIARNHLATFERMWMARFDKDWDEVSQDWRVSLLTREDRDLGWLPKKRTRILKMVEDFGAVMVIEVEDSWLEGNNHLKQPVDSAALLAYNCIDCFNCIDCLGRQCWPTTALIASTALIAWGDKIKPFVVAMIMK